MSNLTQFLKRHSLSAGILLIFLFTWPIDFANAGVLPFRVPYIVSITFGWGISLASLTMTGLTLGKEAVIALLKRFLIWRVGWQWYLIAFLLYPAVFSAAVFMNAARTQTAPDFSTVMAHRIFGVSASLPALLLPFFLFDLLTNGEELGWRGYVLPRLQARYSAVVSGLLVGAIWGLWHLPRFFAPENTGSFPLMMIKTLADGVVYSWVYNNTRGSLLLTAILHAAGNTAGVFLPMANTLSGANLDVYIIAIALLILLAGAIAVSSRTRQMAADEFLQVQN